MVAPKMAKVCGTSHMRVEESSKLETMYALSKDHSFFHMSSRKALCSHRMQHVFNGYGSSKVKTGLVMYTHRATYTGR